MEQILADAKVTETSGIARDETFGNLKASECIDTLMGGLQGSWIGLYAFVHPFHTRI